MWGIVVGCHWIAGVLLTIWSLKSMEAQLGDDISVKLLSCQSLTSRWSELSFS